MPAESAQPIEALILSLLPRDIAAGILVRLHQCVACRRWRGGVAPRDYAGRLVACAQLAALWPSRDAHKANTATFLIGSQQCA
jgi:hypothetical protein